MVISDILCDDKLTLKKDISGLSTQKYIFNYFKQFSLVLKLKWEV